MKHIQDPVWTYYKGRWYTGDTTTLFGRRCPECRIDIGEKFFVAKTPDSTIERWVGRHNCGAILVLSWRGDNREWAPEGFKGKY